jgi:hypothetical protein
MPDFSNWPNISGSCNSWFSYFIYNTETTLKEINIDIPATPPCMNATNYCDNAFSSNRYGLEHINATIGGIRINPDATSFNATSYMQSIAANCNSLKEITWEIPPLPEGVTNITSYLQGMYNNDAQLKRIPDFPPIP